MENFNLLHEFVLVCGIVVTVIILFLLGKKQHKYLHQRLLFAFFFIILVLFLFHYAAYHKIYWLYAATNVLTNGIGFLIGPLIYFYIAALFTKIDFKGPTVWLSFLPYLLYTIIFSIPLSLSNPDDGLAVKYLKYYLDNNAIFYLFETLYLLFFTLRSLKILVQFSQKIKKYYSNLTKMDILWSKRLLYGVVGYLVVDMLLMLSGVFIDEFNQFDIYINVFTILLVVIYLGYYGFFQSQILIPSFLLDRAIEPVQKSIGDEHSKKVNSIFSDTEIKEIKETIDHALINDKLYLNESLTLSNLGNQVQLTDKKLSQFINQELATNFYELVNQHRITAFKAEINLDSNQNLTIWGIASKCGFNSKTSFNRIFKKQTGLTPSQYQKSVGNNPK